MAGASSRADVAIATSFQRTGSSGRSHHSAMRAACGLTKWCINSATLRKAMLPHRAEVVVLTDDAAFTHEECAVASPRVLEFDTNLSSAIASWVARNGRRRASAADQRDLANARFAAATLRKWQLVRLLEYRVVFATDPDVDVFFDGGSPLGSAALAQAWTRGHDDFVASRAQLLAAGDGQIPVNTGVMLLKPSLHAYQIGLTALWDGRFSVARGWDDAGSPRELLRPGAVRTFEYTRMLKENTWGVVCGNADQGLFTYVFLARLDAYSPSRYCPLATKFTRGDCGKCPMPVWHFWAGDKPWWLHYTRCLRWFEFLGDRQASNGVIRPTKCTAWLRRRWERAKALPSNWSCGGIHQCAF